MELIDKQKAIKIASGYCYMANIAKELEKLPAVDAVPIKKLAQAINKIIKCSMGNWYVGRLDGKTEEVVLMDDVLHILNGLLESEQKRNGE